MALQTHVGFNGWRIAAIVKLAPHEYLFSPFIFPRARRWLRWLANGQLVISHSWSRWRRSSVGIQMDANHRDIAPNRWLVTAVCGHQCPFVISARWLGGSVSHANGVVSALHFGSASPRRKKPHPNIPIESKPPSPPPPRSNSSPSTQRQPPYRAIHLTVHPIDDTSGKYNNRAKTATALEIRTPRPASGPPQLDTGLSISKAR
jgi:hypothetical protein